MSWAIKIENLDKLYALGRSNLTAAELINSKLKKILSFGALKPNLLDEKKTTEHQEKREVLNKEQLHGENEFYALRSISLVINEGDRVGIIGPNGCGKSTLLKILSRIVSPTNGGFRFKGRLISLLEIGTGFHGDLTGKENIYLNGTIMGMTNKEITEKLHDIIDFSELGAMIDTPVKRYSSGMYVRLAFAVAAHLESEILIVDEVLAVGDAAFQKKCTEKMLDLANNGRTLIFVSHDMEAVNKVCNRVVRMEHGQIVDDSQLSIQTEENHSVSEVTRAYLEPESEIISYRQWPIGQQPTMQNRVLLDEVSITTSDGSVSSTYSVNEDIYITVCFTNLLENSLLNLHLKLLDSGGHSYFVAMDNHYFPSSRKSGKYRQTCKITSPLLNSGDYVIEVGFWLGEPTEAQLNLNCNFGFTVTDNSDVSGVRGNWPNEWPNSFLRPKLDWDVEQVTENGIQG